MPRRTNGANPERRVVVRQYGGTIRLWSAKVDTTLDQMTDLWNALIAIEQLYRAAVSILTAEDPRITTLDAKLAELDTTIENLLGERRRLRRHARKRTLPEDTDIAQQLEAASSMRRSLRAERKESARQVRHGAGERLEALAQERKNAVSAARRKAAESGLYWGNYNEVIARFEAASMRARKQGSELRPARRGRAGTLAVQVLPPVPTDEFLRGGQGWNTAVFPPAPLPETPAREPAAWLRPYTDCRGKPRALTGVTVVGPRAAGGTPVQAVLDISYHRPLPPDAEVIYVRLTRRRVGVRWVHTIALTCRCSSAVEPASGPTVGIDVGFRRVSGGLRVAVAAWSDGSTEALVLPDALLERHAAIADRQGRLEEAVNAIWNELLAETEAFAVAPEPLASTWVAALQRQAVSRRRSYKGLFHLRSAWPPGWREDLRNKLDDWAFHRDRARNALEAFRNRTTRWGRELRRVWVAGLVRRAGHIVIPASDLHRMTRRTDHDARESPLVGEHRRLARIAGPGHLLAWVVTQAAPAGVAVTHSSDKATWLCHVCGLEHRPADPTQLFHRCCGCGTLWDQDVNAARNRVAASESDGRAA